MAVSQLTLLARHSPRNRGSGYGQVAEADQIMLANNDFGSEQLARACLARPRELGLPRQAVWLTGDRKSPRHERERARVTIRTRAAAISETSANRRDWASSVGSQSPVRGGSFRQPPVPRWHAARALYRRWQGRTLRPQFELFILIAHVSELASAAISASAKNRSIGEVDPGDVVAACRRRCCADPGLATVAPCSRIPRSEPKGTSGKPCAV